MTSLNTAIQNITAPFTGSSSNTAINRIQSALQNLDGENREALDNSPLKDPAFYDAFQPIQFSQGASSIERLAIPTDNEWISDEENNEIVQNVMDSLGIRFDFETKTNRDWEAVRYMAINPRDTELLAALRQQIATDNTSPATKYDALQTA